MFLLLHGINILHLLHHVSLKLTLCLINASQKQYTKILVLDGELVT